MRTRAVAITLIAAALACLPPAAARPRADESPILRAMQDELKRSMTELRLNDQPPPYYISYGVDETTEWTTHARLGATIETQARRARLGVVEVRVGDYSFDNSHFVTTNRSTNATGAMTVPLDDSYDAMRRDLWLATDAAYKRALVVYARKKAAFQNRSTKDRLPDLTKETPAETILPLPKDEASPPEWIARVRDMSAVFSAAAAIQTSDVVAGEQTGVQYFINSEGFKEIEPLRSAWVRVSADTQADDGTSLRDGFNLAERQLADMPPAAALLARTRALAARLDAARTASIGEEYTGPVLVEGAASSEMIASSLVPLALARRPNDVEGPGGRGGGPQQATPFLTRIGLHVLPDAFSVSDTPSLTTYEGRPVAGAYTVDDEGVAAKDVALVENGKLLTLLTSRAPQRRLLQSNGHGRSGAAQAGVFQVKSAQAIPAAQLKGKYLELLKTLDQDFGYIVRELAPGSPVIIDAVKVTPDGAETPVRGLRFTQLSAPVFRNILEASAERPLFNYMTSAGDLVSVIAPSLLYEELEIQPTRDVVQKPPIVPSPLAR